MVFCFTWEKSLINNLTSVTLVTIAYNVSTDICTSSSDKFLFQAGFNAGDGIRYFNIPNSRTPAIVNISSTSNYQQPGLWIFQVDGETVENSGCTLNGGMVFLTACILYTIVF